MTNKSTCIHFIEDNKLIEKILTSSVPAVGDDIRIGGEGREKYYRVAVICWVYDEQENPLDRVNIGVISAI